MNKTKYLQLLNAANKLHTTLSFHEQHLKTLLLKTKPCCAAFKSELALISDTLQSIDLNATLTTVQSEQLQKFKASLEKITKELQRDLRKPSMQIDQSLPTLKQRLDKVQSELVEPAGFDLNNIRQLLDKARPILANCQQHLNLILLDIQEVQSAIDALDQTVHRIDLPHDIAHTAKQLEKVTQDLGALNAHLNQLPQGRARFKTEFLPLRTALANLRLQSESLLKEENVSDHKVEVVTNRLGV